MVEPQKTLRPLRPLRFNSPLLALLFAFVAACAGDATRVDVTPPPAVPTPEPAAIRHEATDQTAPATAQLAADKQITTWSGATLTVGKGWWVTQDTDTLTLEDPDRTLKTVLLEVSEREPIKAASLAWLRVKPDFALKVKDSESPPPVRGWDAVTHIRYETKAVEHRGAIALVRRHGDTQYVALTAGPDAAFDKREAQLTTALWTLKPPGMEEESFRDRTPHEADAAKQEKYPFERQGK